MYPNTMRTTVRHDAKDSLRAILPLVGAVLTTRNERPCQVTFIEDGTSLLSPFDSSLQAQGWSSLGELFEQMAELQIDIFACQDCAAFRGPGAVAARKRLEVPTALVPWASKAPAAGHSRHPDPGPVGVRCPCRQAHSRSQVTPSW